MEDRIACIALLVLPPDLEVPPPATARCGSIWIFEGLSFVWRTPFVSKPSEWHVNEVRHIKMSHVPCDFTMVPREWMCLTTYRVMSHALCHTWVSRVMSHVTWLDMLPWEWRYRGSFATTTYTHKAHGTWLIPIWRDLFTCDLTHATRLDMLPRECIYISHLQQGPTQTRLLCKRVQQTWVAKGIATHCNPMQHTATHCNTLWCTATMPNKN